MSRDVLFARETDRATDLWRRLDARGVSGAPVLDDGRRPLGVVSKTDVTRALIDRRSPDGSVVGDDPLVREIMTCFPIALPEDASVAQASALLADEGVHRVLVVDKNGQLAGVVTALDIARWVARESNFLVPSRRRRRRERARAPVVSRDEISFRDRVHKTFDRPSAELIDRAYQQMRTGEQPQDAGVLRVAETLVRQGADHVAVAAVFLVHLQRAGRIDAAGISRFGEPARTLVTASNALPSLRRDALANRSKDLSDFFTAIARDARTLLVRTALRIAELEELAGHPERLDESARALAQETLDVYVPVAGELGLGALRRQLEDLSFRVLDPETYATLAAAVEPLRAYDDECLQLLKVGIERLLKRNGVRAAVSGRTKGLYSLYRKMRQTGRSAEEIMDKLGMRVIVESVPDCYAVLGLLHAHYQPVAGTFDDYIALPKPSGYRSLHTCVLPLRDVSDKPVEFQIRTYQMHEDAEYGVAAHWRYKRDGAAGEAAARRQRWLEEASASSKTSDPSEFIERLRRRVFEDTIVVFLEGGQKMRLPAGTTAGDVGRHLAGGPDAAAVRVNRRQRPPDYVLADGDTVEIVRARKRRARVERASRPGSSNREDANA